MVGKPAYIAYREVIASIVCNKPNVFHIHNDTAKAAHLIIMQDGQIVVNFTGVGAAAVSDIRMATGIRKLGRCAGNAYEIGGGTDVTSAIIAKVVIEARKRV